MATEQLVGATVGVHECCPGIHHVKQERGNCCPLGRATELPQLVGVVPGVQMVQKLGHIPAVLLFRRHERKADQSGEKVGFRSRGAKADRIPPRHAKLFKRQVVAASGKQCLIVFQALFTVAVVREVLRAVDRAKGGVDGGDCFGVCSHGAQRPLSAKRGWKQRCAASRTGPPAAGLFIPALVQPAWRTPPTSNDGQDGQRKDRTPN